MAGITLTSPRLVTPRSWPEVSDAGPLRSEGIRWERLGEAHFRATLAASRGLPGSPNALQFQVNGARGRELVVEARFEHEDPKGHLDEYFHSATADFRSFVPLQWEEPRNGRANRLVVPATDWDEFYVGMQFPMPAEALAELVAGWAGHPHVKVERLGRSLEGRDIPVLRVTDPEGSEHGKKWHHYLVNQHPGEGNARWRLAGMLDWLLSERSEAKEMRKRTVVSAVPLLCPDGPANGWRRVNADGVDMNRCFRLEGVDEDLQTKEAWLLQRELEVVRPDTLWCLHTWPGEVEPIFDGLGPEFGRGTGDFEALEACFRRWTTAGRVKAPRNREEPGMPTTWNGGVRRRLGLTTVLVEGGGDPPVLAEHRQGGAELMRVIAEFWRGERGSWPRGHLENTPL